MSFKRLALIKNSLLVTALAAGIPAAEARKSDKFSLSISYCTSGTRDFRGVTTVAYTGISPLSGRPTFNVTNVPYFGLPFTQQAEMLDVSQSGEWTNMKLKLLITGSTLKFSVNEEINQSWLSLEGEKIFMRCR